MKGLLDILATAYRLDLDGASYVRHVADAAARVLDRRLGVMVYTYDARHPERPLIDHFAVSGRFDEAWLPKFYDAINTAGLDVASPQHPTGFAAWGHLTCGQASRVPAMRAILPIFRHIGGARDAFALNALDASGRGLWIGAPMKTTTKLTDEHITLFTRVAAHLTSAIRMRRTYGVDKPPPAAVLSPAGELLHAEAKGAASSRDDLRRATLAFDRARTKAMRADPETATRRWRPLVQSRWSLLDDFDTDGRRFVVAVENAPPTRAPKRRLSERELQVMTQVHLGHSDKEVAYELGLSVSTVRVLIHRAMQKLGAENRRDALARFERPRQGEGEESGPVGQANALPRPVNKA